MEAELDELVARATEKGIEDGGLAGRAHREGWDLSVQEEVRSLELRHVS
jgi:hypothetical protein